MEYLKTLFNLEDKVAVITGGSGILGSEMAKGLLKVGTKVVILGTSEEKLKHKVESLKSVSPEVMGLKCNVLDEENIRTVNEKVLNEFGRIDILINAAGGHLPGAVIGIKQNIFDLKIEDLNKVTNLNLTELFFQH